jgi:Kef-type K+ transport system membrane component KefB
MVLSIMDTVIITLTQLLQGITWAFTIAIISLAFFGKFTGCTIAARISGFPWREASTIGALMSCKGYVDNLSAKLFLTDGKLSNASLVELIVLNVGLSAGILSQVTINSYPVK